MIGAVHAGVGAALGSILRDRSSAFLAGVASHVITDALPHRDYRPKIEVPLLAAMLAGIAAWKGADSPEFWGAIGAITPDVEHALQVAGLIKPEHEVFPTHLDNGRYHGRKTRRRWPQLLLTIASLVTLAVRDSSPRMNTDKHGS